METKGPRVKKPIITRLSIQISTIQQDLLDQHITKSFAKRGIILSISSIMRQSLAEYLDRNEGKRLLSSNVIF